MAVDHPILFGSLLAGLGIGVTMFIGGLPFTDHTNHVRRRFGWWLLGAGLLITLCNLAVLLWLLRDGLLAWMDTILVFMRSAPVVYGALGFLGGFALIGAIKLVTRYHKTREGLRSQSDLATVLTNQGTDQPQEPAAYENLEELRQLYTQRLAQCISLACAFPVDKFLQGAKPEECAQLVASLIEEYPFETIKASHLKVYNALAQEVPPDPLAEIMAVVSHYGLLAKWILWAGRAFFSDGLISDKRYDQWYRNQQELVLALKESKRGGGTARVAEQILGALPDLPRPTTESDAEAAANAESVEYFRVLYNEYWRPTLQFAYEFFWSDIDPGLARFAAYLLKEYVLPRHMANASTLDEEVRRTDAFSKNEFRDSLLVLFRKVLLDYVALVAAVKGAGEFSFGVDKFYLLPAYCTLYKRHSRALEKLREARHRSDIGWTTELLIPMLEELLPAPGMTQEP